MSSRPGAPSLAASPRRSRRDEILHEACQLFAERGFARVTVDDVGTACGISGPAIYHHFASKEAMLGEMLVSISQHLLATGETIVGIGADPQTTLRALISAHADFATTNPGLITVQYRDLLHALENDRQIVRTLQRRYVEMWVETLLSLHRELDVGDARASVHATFGLLNSTPYSGTPGTRSATLLATLACRALDLG